MYKCYDCDNLFDYFDTVEDYIGDYGDRHVYETVGVCPYCKSENLMNIMKTMKVRIMINGT